MVENVEEEEGTATKLPKPTQEDQLRCSCRTDGAGRSHEVERDKQCHVCGRWTVYSSG